MNKFAKDKKRRRGVIEKRRRDRINNALSELKRLVPQVVQKEPSEKLEKAEILQLTIEYLRNLDLYLLPFGELFNLNTDYQQMGFQDCLSEISNYLTEVEGFKLQDPFRLRLFSYLKCFSSNN